MNPQTHTAILLVSFGTSIRQARIETLDTIGQMIQKAFPETRLYHAWTSQVLRNQVLAQSGLCIDSLPDALERMKNDGISKVIIQPTFISEGTEYKKLSSEIQSYPSCFSSMLLGLPLLHHNYDPKPIVSAVMQAFPTQSPDELLVFMGHGTSDDDDSLYSILDTAFRQNGHEQVLLKTMRSDFAVEEIISFARNHNLSNITLAPFMISAGRHAQNDLAGEQKNSWKSQLERAGFHVEPILKGLGQNPEIRKIYLDRISSLLSIS